MSASRLWPGLIAAGVVSGIYIWQQPLQEVSGKLPREGAVGDGKSQSVKDGSHTSGPSSQPHGGLKYGGASPVDPSKPTVAGTSAESRRDNSADHDVSTRSDAKTQDGTAGGGVGVAEMRERKMQGMGQPSPQGGDTKAKPVKAQEAYAAEK